MALALAMIRDEHRSLFAVTGRLLVLARETRDRGHTPDFELFTLILDYIEGFSDRFHHPKEDDYLFPVLRRRCPEASATCDALAREHARGEQLSRTLRHLLLSWRAGGPAALEAFVAAVEAYVDFHRRHMQMEEDVILPLADRWLTEADWEPIDSAFRANEDPLRGAWPREAFRRLFQLILSRSPAPVGTGPARAAPRSG